MWQWVRNVWETVKAWPGVEFTVMERWVIRTVVIIVAVLIMAAAKDVLAGSAGVKRPKLDDMPDIQLCVYRADMTGVVAHFWNQGERDWKKIYAKVTWPEDATKFERAAIQEYMKWAAETFIPEYIDKRVADGKPVSTLMENDVAKEAYAVCKYAIDNGHFQKETETGTGVGFVKTASGKPMQEANEVKRMERANAALYIAGAKLEGKTSEQLIDELNMLQAQGSVSEGRYAEIVELINSAYDHKGSSWDWFLEAMGVK